MSTNETGVAPEAIERLYERLRRQAAEGGYRLNPDETAIKGLLWGLLVNEARHGYQACPCRLAAGVKSEDLDIVCPCDYRDADLDQYGACYCGLYVSGAVARGEAQASSIPERRGLADQRKPAQPQTSPTAGAVGLSLPVWRCQVCGYLCGRAAPPELCPICKVSRERFERFM